MPLRFKRTEREIEHETQREFYKRLLDIKRPTMMSTQTLEILWHAQIELEKLGLKGPFPMSIRGRRKLIDNTREKQERDELRDWQKSKEEEKKSEAKRIVAELKEAEPEISKAEEAYAESRKAAEKAKEEKEKVLEDWKKKDADFKATLVASAGQYGHHLKPAVIEAERALDDATSMFKSASKQAVRDSSEAIGARIRVENLERRLTKVRKDLLVMKKGPQQSKNPR
jgi:DNA repair exonuclease SbcCD ATPase subunit